MYITKQNYLGNSFQCMDFGFHNCISRALLMHVTAEEGRQKSVQHGMETLSACINSLDSRLDKQRFLEYNHTAFMIPKKIEFQGQKIDDVSPLCKPSIVSVRGILPFRHIYLIKFKCTYFRFMQLWRNIKMFWSFVISSFNLFVSAAASWTRDSKSSTPRNGKSLVTTTTTSNNT